MDLVDRPGAGEVPQTAFCAQSGAMFNLANRRRRAAAAAAGVTAQAGRGRASAISLKREEAKQADRPPQAKPMASQQLGSLINFATQDQYEKAGERIHRFEIVVKIKARERGLSLTRPASMALKRARE